MDKAFPSSARNAHTDENNLPGQQSTIFLTENVKMSEELDTWMYSISL